MRNDQRLAVTGFVALLAACQTPSPAAPRESSTAVPIPSAPPTAPPDRIEDVPPSPIDAGPTPEQARASELKTCFACCQRESDRCDRGCAEGEPGRGCLRRCGSRRVGCRSACQRSPASCDVPE